MEIVKVPAGPVIVDLLDGDRICHHHRNGGFERESLAAWAEMCARGGTVIDVGAYTGIYAIAAAKLGCEVVAFEPLPKNAERLEFNALLNGVNVHLHCAAASDLNGKATLHYNPRIAFTSGASLAPQSGATVEVDLIRLDDLPLGNVTAVKIDAERAEENVLRGAERLIAEWTPDILIEALDEDAAQKIKALLPGYRHAATLDGRNMLMRLV